MTSPPTPYTNPVAGNSTTPTTTSSGTGFNPYQNYSSTDTTTSSSTLTVLPDGTYDLYNLGSIASNPIFTGDAPGSGTTLTGMGSANAAEHDSSQGSTPTYTKAYQLLEQYAKMSATDPSGFAQIQSEMFNGGFYSSSTTPTFGAWTAKDGDAMSEALRGYLAVEQTGVPMTFEEYLGKVGSAGATQVPPVELTDTATLESKANEAGQADLGRNLTASEQAAFVSKFHGEELNAAEQKATAKTSTGVGTYEGPSRYDAENAADQMIQTQDNAEYQSHLQASYADRMLSMLGVTSGG